MTEQSRSADRRTSRPGEEIQRRTAPRRTLRRLILAGTALGLLAACDRPLDFDMRGNFGNTLDTAEAARQPVANRPTPDARGVISYPNYQVAVARRGDTVADVATRVGVSADELARFNGLRPADPLRPDEVVALPRRVAEPAGGFATGQSGGTDIAGMASSAIDRSDAAAVSTTTLPPAGGGMITPASAAPAAAATTAATPPRAQVGQEPTRHQVKRGETAFTIARLYNVSVRSLAEWNGLGADYTIREGQYLLIPVPEAQPPARPAPAAAVTAPGAGSPTPVPPSAATPLPAEVPKPAAAPAPATTAPDLGAGQSAPSRNAQLATPVQGTIIRDYQKGKNDGLSIQAPSGTAIVAAEAGTVAAITTSADQVPIIVIRHPDNLLTVYANVEGATVKKDDKVTRGQKIAQIRSGSSNYLHFEVRKGFDSVDPTPYLAPR
ncbi:MAG: LysM peptidoglycan-binding domain-containing M23 family metallopeptidase [Rhodobacterales bacterium]|nr:LysM peptidoglycan-binding domain-containing M23 family metallopeptidase [Rhodobacterales bacterium]